MKTGKKCNYECSNCIPCGLCRRVLDFSLNEQGTFKNIREELRRVLDDFHISSDDLSRTIKMQSLNALKMAESGERGLFSLLYKYPLGRYHGVAEIVEQYQEVTREDLYSLVDALFKKENEHVVFAAPRI